MSNQTPVPLGSIPTKAPTIGVSFHEILRYVMKRLRMTEVKAAFSVMQVLRSGIAMKKIEKTEDGRYRLLSMKPPGLVCKIKEMKTSDDDASTASSNSSCE